MTEPQFDQLSRRLWQMLGDNSRRSSSLHGQFLHTRRAGLRDMQSLIALQMGAQAPAADLFAPPARPALFDSRALDAFGTGRISDCFGPDFAHYDTRLIPRIPNGDLKMMSRVVEIHGTRFTGRPVEQADARITVEYDVPADAWYLSDNASPEIPCSLWMETALQPCGFLSAYLDTYSLVPHGLFNFRNLDGATLRGELVDVRGKTITTRAWMLNSVVSSGTVIQKFAFELTCAGHVVYSGESTFGYFSVETMANQVGLDGGRKSPPWLRTAEGARQPVTQVDTRPFRYAPTDKPAFHLAAGQLGFLDSVSFSRTGGRYGLGYVYASRPVNPADWFYPCHFYQDPVMPGSLGIEAMVEALQAYALVNQLDSGLRAPRFSVPDALPLSWRYRGQIIPQNNLMEIDIHMSAVEKQAGRVRLIGDANLWVDGLRIYDAKNLAVDILEGN